jgi:L-cysteine:1D-myo-inositol 2-amino-2-deoxy-alpha-D-glucopyranoside ligase
MAMKAWSDLYIPPLDQRFALPELSLHDTATAEKKFLVRKSIYRIYVCGITPYDATHLGHANTYLAFDLVNRYLRATGAQVKFVENITDIDDPLLERATRDGIDWKDLAHSQIELFKSDMVALHVIPPSHYIGAVEAIPEVIDAIKALQGKGAVYSVDQDLYFEVRSDSAFGSRSNLSDSQMLEIFAQRGGDPQKPGKKDPLDALVWLAQRPNEPGWNSEFGVGRPGWHIECCAIALNYLDIAAGDETSVDIQGGGSDLIFPHHEMSAAQSKMINGREFATHYVHAGMIGLDGEKMSKSKGNLVLVSNLLKEGRDAMAIRLALLSHHYRADHMWTDSDLVQAEVLIDEMRVALSRMEVAPTDSTITEIIAALADDLDTPRAIKALRGWLEKTNAGQIGGSPGELSRAIDALLGIAF